MRVFDQVFPEALEHREFQLGTLAISIIAILSFGLAMAIYSPAFSHPLTEQGDTARKVFYAFCVLSILMVSYLTDRQLLIRKLRREIVAGKNQITLLRNEASADLLSSIPGMSHFQDRLPMELRRCANSGDPLSLLLFLLSISGEVSDEAGIATVYGSAAKVLLAKMRKGDSIYGFQPGAFGIILAACDSAAAERACGRCVQGLEETQPRGARLSLKTRVINFPADMTTAQGMVLAVRSFLLATNPEALAE